MSSLALGLASTLLTLLGVSGALVRGVAALAPLLPAWSSWLALAVGAAVVWTVTTWLLLTLAVAALYAWLALALVRAAGPPDELHPRPWRRPRPGTDAGLRNQQQHRTRA